MENLTYIFAPYSSSNRTAFLSKLVKRTESNFQHQDSKGVYPVAPFEFWEKEGNFYSENPNCLTGYLLIPVPEWFSVKDLEATALMIANELTLDYGRGSQIRAIKADRKDIILATVSKLQAQKAL